MGFKFIHAADLHIDSPMRGLRRRDDAPVQLLRDATRQAVVSLVDVALRESVDFLVIAGDIYDGDWKDYSTGLFFRQQLLRLAEREIPVLMIRGNHDAASVITRQLALPPNVVEFSSRRAESQQIGSLAVTVHGRSFPSRAVTENFVENYPAAVPGHFNIGLLHTSLEGSREHDTYAPCSQADLRACGYDYWALGHIHQPEVLSQDPWIVYSGNTQGRHINERGERGCCLVRVDDGGQVAMQRVATDVVRWQLLEVGLDEVELVEQRDERVRSALQQALDAAGQRPLAVRLQLQGATSLHGVMVLDHDRLMADMAAVLQDIGDGSIWLESVRCRTHDPVDLQVLAERDELTAQVLEALNGDVSEVMEVAAVLQELKEVLPAEIFAALQGGPEDTFSGQLLQDVNALVLATLQHAGGEIGVGDIGVGGMLAESGASAPDRTA